MILSIKNKNKIMGAFLKYCQLPCTDYGEKGALLKSCIFWHHQRPALYQHHDIFARKVASALFSRKETWVRQMITVVKQKHAQNISHLFYLFLAYEKPIQIWQIQI